MHMIETAFYAKASTVERYHAILEGMATVDDIRAIEAFELKAAQDKIAFEAKRDH